ncbi:MAG: RNA polymerase sigma-70 factor [Saprospiraceae bacterium]|nr:RNA polymerase sigma-70 factor [Saprospiraceae bacterium]
MSIASLDRESFRKLFEENYNLLCNYVNSYAKDWDLSQEITQKTFVRLWEKRDEISFSTSSKSYLFQSARNSLIDYYRAHKSATVHAEKYTEDMDVKEVVPVEEDEAVVITHKIAWAVDQLKPKTKEIFLLNKQEGLTYDEIAQYLKISKRTVEYNMKNALLQLKELLKGKI